MTSGLTETIVPGSVPIHAVPATECERWLEGQPATVNAWLKTCEFSAKPGIHQLLPTADGGLAGVLVNLGSSPDLWAFADLAATLPARTYHIADPLPPAHAHAAAVGWALGTYDFARFRKAPRRERHPELALPAEVERSEVEAMVEAERLGRDLINRPASDLGPTELVEEARRLAERHKAHCTVIEGEALIAKGFPAVHAVGRGSPRTPALIDLRWGRPGDPRLTLVGKGVCFDTGGLTIKTEAWMRNMKKDMGGAATALALAHMIMHTGMRVELRVLIPAVENSTSGPAYRPGDVIATRKGLTIEVANCDAEGRVILADALAAADEEEPDIIVDVATLTGAARAALGPEVAAVFCDDEKVADALVRASRTAQDPLWRLPLWDNYHKRIESTVADVLNLAPSDTAGAITAALLLKDFVGRAKTWIHLDIFGWNDTGRPGRPVGGEPNGLRALYAFLSQRYGNGTAG